MRAALGASSLVLLLAACGSVGEVSASAFRERHLSFLAEPELTRTRVQSVVGPPSEVFEGGRIVGYCLLLTWHDEVRPVRDVGTRTRPAPKRQGEYGLILVYDAADRVVRSSVRRVWP